jgi:hypothetical protein
LHFSSEGRTRKGKQENGTITNTGQSYRARHPLHIRNAKSNPPTYSVLKSAKTNDNDKAGRDNASQNTQTGKKKPQLPVQTQIFPTPASKTAKPQSAHSPASPTEASPTSTST